MRGGPALRLGARQGLACRRDARATRASKSMRWFTTDACYVFHPMNAWEEGETIFADVMEYPVAPLFPNADGVDARTRVGASRALDLRPRRRPRTRSGASRWTTWPASSRASTSGAPACATGTAGSPDDHGGLPHDAFDCIAHVDHATGKRDDLPVRRRRRAGRAGFRAALGRRCRRATAGCSRSSIAAPRTAAISSSSTPARSRPARSRVAKLPRRVPFGFHGNWRPA